MAAKIVNESPPLNHEEPLKQIANIILVLNGNFHTHKKSLEDLTKEIEKESSACGSPTIGFKINDLLSLVSEVSVKLSSYKRCCVDVAQLGADGDDKISLDLNGMVSFIKEFGSFSSLFDKRLDAIISEARKAQQVAQELISDLKPTAQPQQHSSEPSDQSSYQEQQPEPNEDPNVFTEPGSTRQTQEIPSSMLQAAMNLVSNIIVHVVPTVPQQPNSEQTTVMLEKCVAELNELITESQKLKSKVIASYSNYVGQGLKKWSKTQDVGGFYERIKEIKTSCTELEAILKSQSLESNDPA